MPISLLLPLVIAAQAPAQAPPQAPRLTPDALRQVDSIAAAEYAKDSLGSLTIGVVSGPSLVWVKSYGYADSARTRLATPTTVYRIASITKQLTAVMLLQLLQDSTVRLSDPVDRYFPEIARVRGLTPLAPPPTLVQLATMTAGLPRTPNDQRKSQSGLPPEWLSILIAALPSTEYVRAPESLKLRAAVPVASSPSLDYGYGLGFQAYRWADTVAVGHSGNLAGYTSQVLYNTQRGFGVIVLRSAAGGEADAGRLAVRAFRKLRATCC